MPGEQREPRPKTTEEALKSGASAADTWPDICETARTYQKGKRRHCMCAPRLFLAPLQIVNPTSQRHCPPSNPPLEPTLLLFEECEKEHMLRVMVRYTLKIYGQLSQGPSAGQASFACSFFSKIRSMEHCRRIRASRTKQKPAGLASIYTKIYNSWRHLVYFAHNPVSR